MEPVKLTPSTDLATEPVLIDYPEFFRLFTQTIEVCTVVWQDRYAKLALKNRSHDLD